MQKPAMRFLLMLLSAILILIIVREYPFKTVSAESGTPALDIISNELDVQFNVVEPEPDNSHENEPATTPSTTEEISVIVDNGDGSGISSATIQRTTNADGTKNDKVTFKPEQAKETVEKAKQSGQTTARIVIPDKEDEVARLDVTIPKETVSALASGGLNLEIYTENAKLVLSNDSLSDITEDFYFRVIPIKSETERTEVEERARVEQVVHEVAGDNSVSVVARPMTIETNLSSRAVDIILPLQNVTLPTDEQEREAFLADLVIFIEHSDGDRQLVKPEVVVYKDGLLGLKFGVNKFSTFTILNMEGWKEYLLAQEAKHKHDAYMQGYPDGTFKPDRGISRAEMAMILSRIEAGGIREDSRERMFPDVAASHWAQSAVQYVNAEGLMSGLPDGNFHPEQSVTRAEMAAIASRWLKLESDAAVSSAFKDTAGHWAGKDIAAVQQAGVMEGYPDGSFQPEKALSRAEAASMINNILKRGSQDWTNPTWSDVPTTYWAFKAIEEASHDHSFTDNADGSESIVE